MRLHYATESNLFFVHVSKIKFFPATCSSLIIIDSLSDLNEVFSTIFLFQPKFYTYSKPSKTTLINKNKILDQLIVFKSVWQVASYD